MWLNNFGNSLEKAIHKINRSVKAVSLITLLAMTFFVAADVIGRYFFNLPIKGGMDIQELMMVVMVFLAMGFIALENQNVRVDLLTSRLKGRTLAIFDTFASLVGFVIVSLITWQSSVTAFKELAKASGQVTLLLHIPVAPFMFVASLGLALMALEIFIQLIHGISRVKSAKI